MAGHRLRNVILGAGRFDPNLAAELAPRGQAPSPKECLMSFTSEYSSAEPTRAEIDALPGPVLVEFGAPWCGYCRAVQATLEGMLEEHPDVTHIKIYDAQGKPLGRSFRVKLWPNLVFLRDGEVRAQYARGSEAEIAQGFTAIAR